MGTNFVPHLRPQSPAGLYASLPVFILPPLRRGKTPKTVMENQPEPVPQAPADSSKNKRKLIKFRVDEAENTAIRQRADAAVLTVSDFVRKASLGEPITTRLSESDRENLRKIGINLNQLTRHANARSQWSKKIDPLVDEIKAILFNI